jgi:hypothetical protein
LLTAIIKKRREVSWDEHKIFIVERILDYGLMTDWMNLYQHTGIHEIGKIAVQIRNLDKKSLTFISCLSNILITYFLCYLPSSSWLQFFFGVDQEIGGDGIYLVIFKAGTI